MYNALPITKVYFIISRNINIAYQKYKQYGPFTIALQVRLKGLEVIIINIYNLCGDSPQIRIQLKVRTAIKEAKEEIILLGDFNAYYLIQGGKYIASKEQAERLLAKTNTRGLILTTLRGEPIQKRGEQESVINLMFISLDLYRKVNFYSIVKKQALIKNYIPIYI